MKKFFIILALLFTFSNAKQTLLVNITTNDNTTTPMAVAFAFKSLKFGFDTSVLLNSKAVALAVKSFKSPACPHGGDTVVQRLVKFVKNGGKVFVCPMCLDAQGYSKTDVIEDFKLGGAKTIMPLLEKTDKVISY